MGMILYGNGAWRFLSLLGAMAGMGVWFYSLAEHTKYSFMAFRDGETWRLLQILLGIVDIASIGRYSFM